MTTDDSLTDGRQERRSLKMGLDFGLSLGKKVNHSATVDNETAKKMTRPGALAAAAADGEGAARTRAFTISK